MYFIIGAVFLIVGAAMVLKPDIIFQITESWKYNSQTEPSNLFLWQTRFGGVLFLVVGIGSMAVQFLV